VRGSLPAAEAIGDESERSLAETRDLFDPGTTARVVLMQNLVPMLATAGSYLTFTVLSL
jgi:PiT family inorganic phosphate transporter